MFKSLVESSDIEKFIYNWNVRFPLDRWWRQKYNVPFGSPKHRESCFIDQLIEFKEDKLFNKLRQQNIKDKELAQEKYILGEGNWMKIHIPTEEEIDKAFDEM